MGRKKAPGSFAWRDVFVGRFCILTRDSASKLVASIVELWLEAPWLN